MEWQTEVNLGGFGDTAEMRWETVRSWNSFTSFFEDARHVDGVTYCESPELLLDLFEQSDGKLTSMDVLVGNRDEYRSVINEVSVARKLERYYSEGKLIIRLKNRKVVHSKLYRILKADDQVTLMAGSANLSYNSWKNQTNSVVVFETIDGSKLDQRFCEWIDHHRERYADTVFMEDLAAELEALDDQEEREQRLNLWIEDRDTSMSERGEIHSKVGDELQELGDTVARIDNEAGDPDEILSTDGSESVKQSLTGDIEIESGADTHGENTVTGVTSASVSDYTITLPTQGFETDGYVQQMQSDLERRGADVGADAITTPVDGYANYIKTRYDLPKMWINEEQGRVHLQHSEHHQILTANREFDPVELERALKNIENYVETVDKWGETNNPTAVKAHMYEGIIYGLWAPFVNLYAREFYGDVTLDNALQYLYVYGESDAGKDKFAEFILRLISTDRVRGSADADEVGKNQIRALRNIDTVFPYTVSDISKKKIERIETLRNFWQDSWHPTNDISYPTIIFTSNDSRPKDWFRNRAKMLHFDIAFPSNPEDEGFYEAQEDLNEVLDTHNPIFAYVSRRILEDERYADATGTVNDVREILLDFYERIDRQPPGYFPRRPANRMYNIGKRKWRQAYSRKDISFERREDHLIANFDLEPHELHSYRKTLPTKMRPEKSGRNILIKNPDDFIDWLDIDGLESESRGGGLMARFFG
jgi:hypothetical protein